MKFSEKLKQAMKELNLNQRQVCGLTGKSKGSVSQYLSDKQIPSEDVQASIAVALGLEEDYFSKKDETVVVLPAQEVRNGIIPKLEVEEAARFFGMHPTTVRKGLQQGVFPWGYGIHTSENRWVYFINAKRFAEIEGVEI
nr:MAG TPA: helix-turn-helix domain protein [Bacteriophage sp.]